MDNFLNEAFQRLSLLEDDFDLSVDRDKIDELKSFVADDVEEIPEEPIIDVEAKSEDELADNYIGKIILECDCCHTRIYKDEPDVIIDEESGLANINDECPVCNNALGYTVIGKIEDFNPDKNIEPEADVEAEDSKYEKTADDLADEKAYPADDVKGEPEVKNESYSLADRISRKHLLDKNNIDENVISNLLKATVPIIGALSEGEEANICPDCGKNPCECGLKEEKIPEPWGPLDTERTEEDKVSEACTENVCPECGKNPCECDKQLNEGSPLKGNPAELMKFFDLAKNYGLTKMAEVGAFIDKHPEAKLAIDLIDALKKENNINESVEISAIDEDNIKVNKNNDGTMNIEVGEPEAEEPIDKPAEEIVPLNDEEKEDIEANKAPEEEENPEAGEENNEEAVNIDDFDEESFDNMGEAYLRKTYSNVESYKTTSVKDTGSAFVVEGIINYKSGKKRPTKFIFESARFSKKGKLVLEGRNETFTKSKRAFSIRGSLVESKFLPESFTYNYTVKHLNESNDSVVTKVSGKIKNK